MKCSDAMYDDLLADAGFRHSMRHTLASGIGRRAEVNDVQDRACRRCWRIKL